MGKRILMICGVQMTYVQYLRTRRWKAKADGARERANWRCQVCGGERPLQVHHNSYDRLGNELASDLIALCAGCHRHNWKRLGKAASSGELTRLEWALERTRTVELLKIAERGYGS